jgi:hypothetical protein
MSPALFGIVSAIDSEWNSSARFSPHAATPPPHRRTRAVEPTLLKGSLGIHRCTISWH